MIGAQVKWKDTKIITVTDVDGKFSIRRTPQSNTLVISYIGYKLKEQTVGPKQNNIKVNLAEDAQNLDELVVVGYGVQKKSSLTGSVETIKSSDLLIQPTTNLDQALTAQVAGLQVMESTGDPGTAKQANIRVRGISQDPLLVIDGVPRFSNNTSDGEMRLSDLNPDDIESITILKDAAASAVYGSRAANGVILVQTKRAQGEQKVRVNYRGQFNLQTSVKEPKFLDAYQFALLRNQAVANTPDTKVEAYTDEQLEQIRTHSNPNVYGDTNLYDYLKSTGSSMTHSVSFTGGNSLVRYYLSMGYASTKGLYSGVGRDRINYSAKIDATLAKGLVFSVDFTGTRSDVKNNSYTTLDAAYSYSPVQVFEYTDGRLASINGQNPLINVRGLGTKYKDRSRMNTITANLNWDVKWVKGLSAYLRGTFDDNSQINQTFYRPVALYTYDEQTGQTIVNPNTVVPTAKATTEQQDMAFDTQLYEIGINYNRTFAEKHDVGATLVANYQRSHSINMRGKNNDSNPVLPIMGTAMEKDLSGNEVYNQRASLVGRANYGYGNRYFAEFSFRVDGSNNFHPDRRWGFFPSVSAAWVLSNEPFFKDWNQKVLSNVKFRASSGLLGNDGYVSAFSYLKTYIESPTYGYGFGDLYRSGLILSSGSYPNPYLTWGKTRDWNFATDLGFWDGRIGISYEYFIRYETNRITSAPSYLFPPSMGTYGSTPSINFSKLKVWGWELTVNHRNTIGKFKYNVALTIAKADNKFLDYGDESNQAENLRRAGHPASVWRMYQADGLFQTQEEIDNWELDQDGAENSTLAPGDIKYIDQNGDHVLDSRDLIMVKDASYPDMDFGLRLGASYKGFYINAVFQAETGYKKNIQDLYSLDNGTLPRFQEYHLTDTWSPDNPNAMYPRIKFATSNDNNRRSSTFWIRDCNFLRLKALNIGYSIPTSLLSKLHINSASIALQGSNLFTLSNLKDMDPESLRGYPIQRSYGISLNLGF